MRAAHHASRVASHEVRPATGDMDSSSGSSLISASAAGSAETRKEILHEFAFTAVEVCRV